MGIDSLFLSIAFALYFLAEIVYVIFLVTKWGPAGKTCSLIAFTGLICHTIALVSRMIIAKRLVGYNFYEYMSVFAWGTVLIYLIAERKTKLKIIGVFVLPVVILLLGYASVLPKNITPLVPALRSYWLQIHIITTVVSYSSFTLSFSAGIIYIVRGKLPFPGESDIQSHNFRFSLSDHRYSFRRNLGSIYLEQGMELGPQRNLLPRYMAGLCCLSPYQACKRLERETCGNFKYCRFCLRYIYLSWGGSSCSQGAYLPF